MASQRIYVGSRRGELARGGALLCLGALVGIFSPDVTSPMIRLPSLAVILLGCLLLSEWAIAPEERLGWLLGFEGGAALVAGGVCAFLPACSLGALLVLACLWGIAAGMTALCLERRARRKGSGDEVLRALAFLLVVTVPSSLLISSRVVPASPAEQGALLALLGLQLVLLCVRRVRLQDALGLSGQEADPRRWSGYRRIRL